METTKLKKFAQQARVTLIEQVATKLKFVRAEESLARRENPIAVKKLEELIKQQSEQEVVERIAYIWFNRFCALRFMDMNRYNRSLVVSAAAEDTQPEVLALAKAGDIDERVVSEAVREQILNLLNGRAPSQNPEAEVYRLLLVAYCNQWHESMPFLFQRIDDYTELLMPDDLLSSSSVLADMREAMPASACKDVEVIGWLYQFYISDKKDDVFARLKKNEKVTPENIPAATQLFTPHWIVRYLVENSLGRLWLLNHPESKLADRMEYYIKPAEDNDDTDYLKVESPKDLKICDPACGSGHMLTYAFDLLYAIYEEQGYGAADIPSLILTHNLYGIEIDERAGELAAFALTMKARDRHRRFFNTDVRPNICVLEPISFDDDELDEYMDFIGRDLFTADLEITLRQFDEADNFGSLIRPELKDVAEVLEQLHAADVSGQLFLSQTHQKVLKLLKQADYLSPHYHIVVANPPYMGGKGMNGRLKAWSKKEYPNSKSDLFSMFVERCLGIVLDKGELGFITPFLWMFIGSFEAFREDLLSNCHITSLVQLEYNSFGPACVPVCTFTVHKKPSMTYEGRFIKLTDFKGENIQAPKVLEAIDQTDVDWSYKASTTDFLGLPSKPIAFWISDNIKKIFKNGVPFSKFMKPRQGLATADNDRFLRRWHEVEMRKTPLATYSGIDKWFPHSKGGTFRRWYGNNEWLVNWENSGSELKAFDKSVIRNEVDYLKGGFSWSDLTSSYFNSRHIPEGFVFDTAGPTAIQMQGVNAKNIFAFSNSKVFQELVNVSLQGMHYSNGVIGNTPIKKGVTSLQTDELALVDISKGDWDSYETSWEFKTSPLLKDEHRKSALKDTYIELRAHWQQMTYDMQRLEEENNRIFIDAYGLQDELTPEVPLKEITLTCNPYYRYGGEKTAEELETLLLADTMRELISYAVGCMFGRYSLDKPGLILANQGDKIEQYFEQIPNPSFMPDKNNVIPILDDGWFSDDIVERFRKFIKVAFGEEQYESNMQFIEQALGKNDKPRDIRDYFLKDFYDDHVKRYKKRPIYWLFTSGNFSALIYMHRYQPDTVSIVLNDYLREFRTKLNAYKDQLNAINISASQSQSEKTKAQKKLDITNKMITEMEDYEREVLYPLATKQIEIDLDDGVKVNYPKFGKALKKVTGLS
ncbi:BREX-1 system adenine-specific DNA-methyltransferase PglX [Psychrobacter sp. JCM 18900]|uniref:BREX-1 system adenine-specific DNA-methyltransferase PglX n=1 Tax=Psychrobacter sp. JCM 18900 TaxID=1298608 RepID=UPI00191B1805|nr:BREX-1 system adenine-specific DNA-methyltransferase PglX [Psychrobacter sp. JCM 18900]